MERPPLKPWENCESDLVLVRNCAARFANSADSSKVLWSVSRRTSHMVSLGSPNSIQQSKIRCTNYATSPQVQLREFSAPIDCTSLRRPIFPILAWIIMLLFSTGHDVEFLENSSRWFSCGFESDPPMFLFSGFPPVVLWLGGLQLFCMLMLKFGGLVVSASA